MEEKDTRKLLEEELQSQIEGLGSLEIGSKELGSAVDNVATLYKLRIDEMRLEADIEDKSKRQESELVCRDTQQKEADKDRFIKIVLSAVEIGVPTALMLVTLNFEKTGNLCSAVGRKLLNQFKFGKK